MKIAVQFGAGNMGRGFMAQLFWEAGYSTVFIESAEPLVHAINKHKCYTLKLLDAYNKREIDMLIDRVRAISSQDIDAAAEAVRDADIVGTAVGVKNLGAIAVPLAAGIEMRYRKKELPVDVYLCENLLNASTLLKEEVFRKLNTDSVRRWAEQNIGFVGTVVARMVPTAGDRRGVEDQLSVVADSYHKLPYDGKAARAAPPEIEGIMAVENFRAEVEKKLFVYNMGHAALAYLGYLKGYTCVHEPFKDGPLIEIFQHSLDETTRALLKRYPEDITTHQLCEVRHDVDVRFSNPLIMDTVYRVGRDPARKLGPEDRLIGSARLCLSQEIIPENVSRICGAALCYDYSGDPEAVSLQEKIKNLGIAKTIQEVCRVEPASELGMRIIGAYDEMKRLRNNSSTP
jgi:mannitol-1-phosphate 5-dehydrogenase